MTGHSRKKRLGLLSGLRTYHAAARKIRFNGPACETAPPLT